jgi:hypothetical protein
MINQKKINIVYILPESKKPSGGAKVIYEHSAIINKLQINNFSSEIVHLKKKNNIKIINSLKKKFFYTKKKNEYGWKSEDLCISKKFLPSKQWIKSKIVIRLNANFNKKKDFVIFPEILAHLAEDYCLKDKIKYAILVQGGYALNSTSDFNKINKCYSNAEFILTTSFDALKCINYIFPNIYNKVIKINLSIDPNRFVYRNKKNIITYMPRKLASDFHILKIFLKSRLSSKWKLLPIENLEEKKLNEYLCKSKIFLSFSDFEGFGLPPVEAALAGNVVIGYTGEGGKEYWKKPIFHRIFKGDILNFSKKILYFANKKYIHDKWLGATKKSRQKLLLTYSRDNEIKSIKLMLKKILNLFE